MRKKVSQELRCVFCVCATSAFFILVGWMVLCSRCITKKGCTLKNEAMQIESIDSTCKRSDNPRHLLHIRCIHFSVFFSIFTWHGTDDSGDVRLTLSLEKPGVKTLHMFVYIDNLDNFLGGVINQHANVEKEMLRTSCLLFLNSNQTALLIPWNQHCCLLCLMAALSADGISLDLNLGTRSDSTSKYCSDTFPTPSRGNGRHKHKKKKTESGSTKGSLSAFVFAFLQKLRSLRHGIYDCSFESCLWLEWVEWLVTHLILLFRIFFLLG